MPSSKYYKFKTENKKEKLKKIKTLVFRFFILIGFLTLIWLIFFSPIFGIRDINVSDNAYLSGSDVKNIIVNIEPWELGKNLLVLSKGRLKEKLAAAFPAITNIVIKKNLFHTLSIEFKKRIQLGIWCNGSDCYYFDKEGTAFAKAPLTEGGLILKIEDKSKNNISLGDRVLNNDQINFITVFSGKISENNKFKILEFKIKPSLSVDLEAVTNKSWLVYLDEKQNPSETVNNLLTILEEAVKNTGSLEYVDLRIPSRVFYKLK